MTTVLPSVCRSISAVVRTNALPLRQLRRPLLLVKVMIPPLSPASTSLYPSLCYLHIKLHLTSISVMESGASGWGLTTTQHLPPRLCCFSMPTVSCSRQSPAAPLLPPHLLTKCFTSAWESYTFFCILCYLHLPGGSGEKTTCSRINAKCWGKGGYYN